LTVTTAVQPRDKGHEKVKLYKIDITFDTLRLQSSFVSKCSEVPKLYLLLENIFSWT